MRIGTRGSALALAQARHVAELLGGGELVTIRTAGDRESGEQAPLRVGREPSPESVESPTPPAHVEASAPSDKSRWVLELERALVAGEIDLAVHSAKDVPGELGDGLELLGAPARAAVEDVLCGARALEELAPGARVGTSSLRRAAQLRAARADLEPVALRGNVDTRLRKLAAGDSGVGGPPRAGDPGTGEPSHGRLDAIVLARAGLQRLGREGEIGAALDLARFVPAPGQGTLALEGRVGDDATRAAAQAITDETAFAALRAERALARALDASCATPLGAHAADAGCGCLHMRAWLGLPDGSQWIADELLGGFYEPEGLGRRVAERMLSAGAGELLRATKATPQETG